MIFAQLGWLAVSLGVVTSLALVSYRNWRWNVIALALQYVVVFWLTAVTWPLGLAAVKLIVGWMALAVISASQSGTEGLDVLLQKDRSLLGGLSGLAFSFLVGVMIVVFAVVVAPQAQIWIPAALPVVQGGLLLIGMGLLQLGVNTHPLRIGIGLLTTLSGFEILYSSVEVSILVAGLLGVITLGIALGIAYLLLTPDLDGEGQS